MTWLAGTVAIAVVLAAVAVWVRRRFGPDALLGTAVGASVCLIALAVAMALRSPPRDGLRWVLFVVIPAVLGGTAALTIAVDRVIRSSTIPDPLPETVFGVVAFLAGVLGGGLAGIFVVAMTIPRIA
jgi:hypothetical protein